MKIGYLMQEGVPDVRRSPLEGPANHVRNVFKELCNLGHHLRLVARFDGRLWKSEDLVHYEPIINPLLDRGVVRFIERVIRRIQYELKLPYLGLFDSFQFAFACCQELSGFDILFERMGWMGYGGGLAAQRLGIPLILEVNGDHLSELKSLGIEPKNLQRWLSIKIMRSAAHRVTRVIATGESWRQCYIDQWQVDPCKVIVVKNGTELVNFLHKENIRCFRSSYKPDESVNLIYVGAFEPWNGLDVLIKAFKKIIDQKRNVHLTLVGGGSLSKKIEHLIIELDLQESITLTGALDIYKTASILANSDIGVSPYCGRQEYSGLKLLDYKASGLATIASGENGNPADIEHGKTGLIVPPCGEEALVNAVAQLMDDVELRKRMGRTARLEAELYHSWRRTAKELEGLFCQVLANSSV